MVGLRLIGLGLLQFRNDDKLHLSNGPGLWTWAFSVGLAVLGLVIAILATDCVIKKCTCIIGSFVLALMSSGEWKDCVMDRNKNIVTLTRCNWYGRLCSQVPAINTRMISLGYVSGVETRGEALLLVLFSSATVVIGTHTNLRHLRYLQEEVASFLRLGRVEHVRWEDTEDDWYSEYWDAMDSISDHEQAAPAMQRSGVKVLVEPVQVAPHMQEGLL